MVWRRSRNREDGLLGCIERVLGLDAFVVADLDDLGASIDQAAQRGCALDNASVVLDVDRGRDRVG